MSLLTKSQVQFKLGDYGTATALALTDPTLHSRVQDHRRMISSRMIPLESNEIVKRLPANEYHISRKIDGEFAVLVWQAGEALLVNPGGTVRVGLPVLKEAAELLKKAGIQHALVGVELWVERTDGKRPRVHDVSATVSQPARAEDLQRVRLAVFDWIELERKPVVQPYAQTWQQIETVFRGGKLIQPVETLLLNNTAAIAQTFDKWVKQEGAEGLVARGEAVGLFKIKPRHSIDVVVLGFTEATEDRVGMLHDLLVGVVRPEGTLHMLGHVGGGFNEEQRRSMLSDLKDLVVDSDYAEVNSDHVAYQMVRPEWVIEMSCLDLISQTTRGGSIKKMVLQWNAAAQKYEILRPLPLASVISPQFVRRREDKTFHPQEASIRQITARVEVPYAERDARQLKLSASTVLRREVYTKILKGATMVRKLLAWQTNKETESEDFPAFVLHYTDFSPDRKQPLQRELRVTSSREQLDQLWNQLIEDNVKKGWTKVESAVAATATSPAPVAVAEVTAVTVAAVTESGTLVASATVIQGPMIEAAVVEPAVEVVPEPAAAPAKKASKRATKKAASVEPAPVETSTEPVATEPAKPAKPAKKGTKKAAAAAPVTQEPVAPEPVEKPSAPAKKAARKKKS